MYGWLRDRGFMVSDSDIIAASAGCSTYTEVSKVLDYKNPTRIKKVLNSHNIYLHITDDMILEIALESTGIRDVYLTTGCSYKRGKRVIERHNITFDRITDEDIIQAAKICTSYTKLMKHLTLFSLPRIKRVLTENNIKLGETNDT